MNDNERDTHFQEFAELVRRDLSEIIDEPLVKSSANFEEFKQKTDRLKQIIAQRAYDLMEHIMLYAPAAPVPDMTEWPEREEKS